MKISVIGCGYLGAVHAACMAELGHDVVGIDVDAAKIASLAAGAAPFFEPGLPELLSSGVASGRLRFSTDIAEARGATVHFVAVGTPQKPGSDAADLRFVDASFEALLEHVGPGDLVVGKSTVPVGTASRLAETVEAAGATLAWNPEFLREGFAVQDTISPDRLVYGVRDGDDTSVATLDAVYASAIAAETPRLVTDYATAELVKVAANAFLATKISFINAMSVVADATGANITQLADAIGHDARIGRRFLNAGVGFGGGCLPKDIRGFMARADELGVGESLAFLKNVDAINLAQRERVVQLAVEAAGGDLTGTRVAILGLAFKPDSDDVRDSPALDVAARLVSLGAIVKATDPEAIETSRRVHPDLDYVATVDEAAAEADIVVLLTEWKQYRELDPAELASITSGRTIIDGRNVLDSSRWRGAGWEYRGLGRP
ncbi:UDPglucose 6-dehydrogenase [Microbacteriaceae bacterium SG_E_30_P1]|uniref:UDP-glucose 6-dehydrogenase n=1 Tax=Antiquaquibacter oligotrophicus TaxID=2880260 RepID=A0ABT6KPK9_9MICO|nr:UDP-glucose/GDP-mannose dehydrogenase family protein [Antiquaquibacter oligotrophicus]MDH6181736.1 UDPglucose 6-dehydrogenase [Antiquaquibacter oligotrophicus]UDF12583.1 UDP-glucose/GDP-mannose dehydrogenase family protein [Antiquaquibacter oligotrophicus]